MWGEEEEELQAGHPGFWLKEPGIQYGHNVGKHCRKSNSGSEDDFGFQLAEF